MDITNLVQKKLGQDLVCKQAIECTRVENGKRCQRFAAIVEQNDEYSVFLFSSSQIPCLQSTDLVLEIVIAVDIGLRCQAEAPTKQHKHQGDINLYLKSVNSSVLLEMPRQDTTTDFLTEIIKKSKSKQTLSTIFSEPTTSQWLNKYGGQELAESTALSGTETSAEDIFDPLKYMNIEQTDSLIQETDSSNGDILGIDGDMASSSLNDSASIYKSSSRDSLDKIANIQEDLTDSMENMQKVFAISRTPDLSVGKITTGREKLVRQFLNEREKEFTDKEYFTIFCGSWNVNGQSPHDPLQKWLLVDSPPPDIYAIGFQEIDLSKEAFIFAESPKEIEWQNEVKNCISNKVQYKKIKSVRLVGVLLVVYIQEKHVPYVHLIDSDSVATGMMGIMGNKGGVSVRFTLHNTSMCFINSHLAAHQEEFERRNSDYRDILSRTRFKKYESPLEITEHDMVFWCGDLNYRIDLPIDDVKAFIKQSMYERLLRGDQLYRMMKMKLDVFKGFEEGNITFAPTYKFDIGTDNYDTSEKNRIPAWCDRILWRGKGVQQLRYSSHPALKVSDHKPISSCFKVEVKVLDQTRYRLVYEDIMKQLDRLENNYLPQIILDKTEFVFKDVKFVEPQKQVVNITNTGKVDIELEFVNKLNDSNYCKPWMKISPSRSFIQAGQTIEIILEVYVDKATVNKFNSGEEKLDDILVLHLVGGKDFFITVTGNYLLSTFGSSIEALIQMREPIRDMPLEEVIEIEQPGSLNELDITIQGGRLLMVPKEIWKLVEFLTKHALKKTDLFREPGRMSEIQLIRDCLDTGKPERIPDNFNVNSVAEAFLLFLECLSQPLIPYEFYSQCLASSNNLFLSKQLLSHMPDCHKNTFVYICGFLHQLLEHSSANGLDSKFLSIMFAEVMLREPPESELTAAKVKLLSPKGQRVKMREIEAKKAAFMHHFLAHNVEL